MKKNIEQKEKLLLALKDPKNCARSYGKIIDSLSMQELEIEEASVVEDSKCIAGKFNEYFTTIGSKLAAKFADDDEFTRYFDGWSESVKFQYREISLDQLEKITKIVNNSAPGFDDLTVQVFKNNFEVL